MPTIAEQLITLSSHPGVYLFKDAAGHVLYVGKAKRLRTRVQSYFREHAALDPAKQQMVPQIVTIETIACDNEHEALILEANLIRQHQPPYNVVLTDDKYYLFIKITKEAFPRVFPVRRLRSDGARYFGPYSSASAVRHTLRLLRRLFPVRDEKESPHEWIFPHPLFATANNDPAVPSPGGTLRGHKPITPDPSLYQQNIQHIIRFLEGKRNEIIATLRSGMQTAAQSQHYERARLFRDQLHALERLEGNQKVYLPRAESFDMISLASTTSRSAANVFAVRQGKLLNKHTFLLRHRHAAEPADILRQFILQYYGVAQDIPATIYIPLSLPDEAALAAWINRDLPPTFHVPYRGQRRQLLQMGETNAQELLRTEAELANLPGRYLEALEQLATALELPTPPARVEIYDISHLQGSLTTGSMVVFSHGQGDKAHYKRFRLHQSGEPNDYASLQEVLRRRFSGRHADWPLPDLVIIDGGKGQLSAAVYVLRELNLALPIISLAKREEEIFRPHHSAALRLPPDSEALYLLQRMRDEAHRFTITYHRHLRSHQQRRSLLDEVPGIGPTLKRNLLTRFGSLKAIRQASDEELSQVIGQKVQTLRDYL